MNVVALYGNGEGVETKLTARAGVWAGELLGRLIGCEGKGKDEGVKGIMGGKEKEDEVKWGLGRRKVDEGVVNVSLEKIVESGDVCAEKVVPALIELGDVKGVEQVVEKVLERVGRVQENVARVVAGWKGYEGLGAKVRARVVLGCPDMLLENEIENSRKLFESGRCVSWIEGIAGVETLVEGMFFDLGVFWEVCDRSLGAKERENQGGRQWWRAIWSRMRALSKERNDEETVSTVLRWGVKWRGMMTSIDRGYEYVLEELQIVTDNRSASFGEVIDLISIMDTWIEDGVTCTARGTCSLSCIKALSSLVTLSISHIDEDEKLGQIFDLETLKKSKKYKDVLFALKELHDGRLNRIHWRSIPIWDGYLAAACAALVAQGRCGIRKCLEGQQTSYFLREILGHVERTCSAFTAQSEEESRKTEREEMKRLYALYKIAAEYLQKFVQSNGPDNTDKKAVVLKDLQRRCSWVFTKIG